MDIPCKVIYGSGHASLDRDHSILLGILRKLKSPQIASEEIQTLGIELLAYLDAHFEHEEYLMDQYRYPGTAAHKQAHRQIQRDADSLVHSNLAQGSQVGALVQNIQGWIETHVCQVDARLAEFLHSLSVARCDPDGGIFLPVDTPEA